MEVLVVLTIISLVVGSISYVMFKDKDDLQSLSQQVVQAMQLLQQRAIRDDRPYQIEIDLEANSISFMHNVISIPGAISMTVKTAESQLIEDARVGMTFYPDSSSSGGFIELESEREIYQIVVVWISGKIISNFIRKAGA